MANSETARTEGRGGRVSREALARLWPNREHESNWLKNLACRVGWHRWHEMRLEGIGAKGQVRFCLWCPEIRTAAESEANQARS